MLHRDVVKTGRGGDSHQSLARAIARDVQARLPTAGSGSALEAFVEERLHAESCSIELTLGYLRIAALAAITIVAFAGTLAPASVQTPIPTAASASAVVALLTAVAFALALRSGWYHRRLRRVVPIADAVLIVALVLLFRLDAPAAGRAGTGVAATAASACVFLVLSGSARLSAGSQRIAAVTSILAWIVVGALFSMPWLLVGAVAVFLLVLAVLGTRFAAIVRGLVTTEAHGARLGGLYDDARAAVDAREEVLKMVAHDLRNPLNTISMTAQLMHELPGDDESRARHAGIIGRATASMNKLIHDLLDVARLEAGHMAVAPQPVDPQRLLERASELMRPIAEGAHVRLNVLAEPDLPAVLVDEERTLQVFSNLTGNAVKFTPPQGTITLRARRELQTVRFSVIDTGPGIPPELAERIFDRFWQADASDRRGIGLGLAIARSIVEAHGQRIGVDCPSSGGSDFWFTAAIAD